MEKIYDAPANYDDIIKYVQNTDDNKLNEATDKLVILLIKKYLKPVLLYKQ